MHTPAVRARPNAGTSQKAVASTPSTAPKVLPAYSAARARPGGRQAASTCAIAGKVAPIAAVAGSSKKKVPTKATVHCQSGDGCAPVRASSAPLAGAISSASATLQPAMASSQPAYQRAGCGLRSMRGPSASAPSASPPKNAATTASTAADSWPSHSALCWVQTIW